MSTNRNELRGPQCYAAIPVLLSFYLVQNTNYEAYRYKFSASYFYSSLSSKYCPMHFVLFSSSKAAGLVLHLNDRAGKIPLLYLLNRIQEGANNDWYDNTNS